MLVNPAAWSCLVGTVVGEDATSGRTRHRSRERWTHPDRARALQSAGASWLTVHARTKADAYKPPAL